MPEIKLIQKAQNKARRLKSQRQDFRYLKTMGKLKYEGLMDVSDISVHRGQVFLSDALWAAELEPRISELLPAIIARRPSIFAFLDLPEDLYQVVREIKAGHPVTPYRGITPQKYGRWIPFVGRVKSHPKVMRSYRLSGEDIELLARLAKNKSASFAEILHQALDVYAKSLEI